MDTESLTGHTTSRFPSKTTRPAHTQDSVTSNIASFTPAPNSVVDKEENKCSFHRDKCVTCGVVPISVMARIINGEDASPEEYPYQVLVFTTIEDVLNACGGAIIKKQWVLTAAHCFFGNDNPRARPSKVTVKGGSIYRNKTFVLPVRRYITHEHFRSSTEGDDIALVQLSVEIDFTFDPHLKPICLGGESDIPYGGKAVATGWGKVKGKETFPITLQEVSLDVITIDQCASMTQLPNDTSKVICALTPHKDTCQGDSGGPLVAKLSDGRWAQIGITSYGLGCARPKKPGVYVRVAHYLPWIKAKTGTCTC